MDKPGVLSTRIETGIGIITLGSAERVHFDPEMADCLFDTLKIWAADDSVRAIVLTGGAPGYFIRHYSVAAIIAAGEAIRASGVTIREDQEAGFFSFDHAIALCETMPKPVIAALSGSCMGGAFELALACDIRIAEDGPYQIGLPEINLGILPGAGGTQRLPRTIGTAAALMHILMGDPISPREAERRGFVHETVSGKALTRAMDIAKHLCGHDAPALAYIKRLVREATSKPLKEGLNLERNLFSRLAASDAALKRMRDYEAGTLTFLSPD
ncbi:MAG: enoyl-CoA hydratase/isomerase family protein [Proteobacteria bacterium]|nr:enoyl-CoA hydratase/isomerase family protein [Pseudomonadota bacterium]